MRHFLLVFVAIVSQKFLDMILQSPHEGLLDIERLDDHLGRSFYELDRFLALSSFVSGPHVSLLGNCNPPVLIERGHKLSARVFGVSFVEHAFI